MSYVAYTRSDVSDPATRPIAFLYDGGPGFASIWINVGAFGPQRVVTADAASSGAPPYRMVANEYSLLDRADLVFIDPVGTGFSHAVGKAHDRDFWGVDPDVRSLAQFIRKYISRHDRWNSPKFLMGLSYGTFRSAALGNYLQSHDNIYINGIVLISSVLDMGTTSFRPGADLPVRAVPADVRRDRLVPQGAEPAAARPAGVPAAGANIRADDVRRWADGGCQPQREPEADDRAAARAVHGPAGRLHHAGGSARHGRAVPRRVAAQPPHRPQPARLAFPGRRLRSAVGIGGIRSDQAGHLRRVHGRLQRLHDA